MSGDIKMAFLTWTNMGLPPASEKLLSALESSPAFRPTHWGPDEFARHEYEHVAVLAKMVSSPVLARKKPPRYLAFFDGASDHHPSLPRHFSLRTKGAYPDKHVPEAFALAGRVAEVLTPELGYIQVVDQTVSDVERYHESMLSSESYVREFGLLGVSPRTWLGPELVRRIGRDLLQETGCLLRDTSWGGVVLDLSPEPWKAPGEELFRKQQEALATLRRSGQFATYEGINGIESRPGPNWAPLQPPARQG